MIREIPIPEIPFPIPDFLKTQKKLKNPGIFPEFPLDKNYLECWCFYDKYNNSNINAMKVEMNQLTKMLLFNVINIEMLWHYRILTVNDIEYIMYQFVLQIPRGMSLNLIVWSVHITISFQ